MTRYFDVTGLVFVTKGHWPVTRNMSQYIMNICFFVTSLP